MGETLSLPCPFFKWFLDCSILLNAAPNLGLRRGQKFLHREFHHTTHRLSTS